MWGISREARRLVERLQAGEELSLAEAQYLTAAVETTTNLQIAVPRHDQLGFVLDANQYQSAAVHSLQLAVTHDQSTPTLNHDLGFVLANQPVIALTAFRYTGAERLIAVMQDETGTIDVTAALLAGCTDVVLSTHPVLR